MKRPWKGYRILLVELGVTTMGSTDTT
ncbi:hypothetical protein Goarm_010779 [Gossypium armourianum]|uniref:Uncharacterized protein n=3 Tax=Gossypium TaxID=3633 RepID=A0A7J9BJE9_GOSGO|nr:hypothetical protein [Gossypium lobatum]MBA0736322.1 hypothetical protein [Gossypium gossypioides]MBA0825868.1 hypothetical protein [Gossypium armourianum]